MDWLVLGRGGGRYSSPRVCSRTAVVSRLGLSSGCSRMALELANCSGESG
jgi:hypothetical protein